MTSSSLTSSHPTSYIQAAHAPAKATAAAASAGVSSCYGPHCFGPTHEVIIAACVVTAVSASVLAFRSRAIYRKRGANKAIEEAGGTTTATLDGHT